MTRTTIRRSRRQAWARHGYIALSDLSYQRERTKAIYRYATTGNILREAEANVYTQTAQLKPLRGFDRLAAAGFSEEDIANIRLQFHTHSARDYLDQEFDDQEDCTPYLAMSGPGDQVLTLSPYYRRRARASAGRAVDRLARRWQ